MNRIENGIHRTKCLSTETRKNFLIIYAYEENFLKRILMHLYYIKHNKNNICHSDVQNHVSYKKRGWYKYYTYIVYRLTQNLPIQYGMYGEMF